MRPHDDPTDSQATPIPFGKRFADTWRLLQADLADLDEQELAELERADLEGTLRILAAQPEVGQASTLQLIPERSAEALALDLVSERLRALTERLPGGEGEPWGSRFLAHWRSLGGPLSAFPYAQLQALKQADRNATLSMFRSAVGGLQVTRVLQGLSPEGAAECLERELAARTMTIASILIL